VRVQLEHVLSGERPRGVEVQGDPAIDRLAALVREGREQRVPRLGNASEQGLGDRGDLGPRDAHDAYAAATGGCRDRGDRVISRHGPRVGASCAP
jgi:hypothetical protein